MDDEGIAGADRVIGSAETLAQAIALAERLGYAVRTAEEGGCSRFVPAREGQSYFSLTVYAE